MKDYKALTFSCGFIRVIEGLMMLTSLGFYYPNFEVKFLCWNYERELAKGR